MAIHRLPKDGKLCDECGGEIIRPIIGRLKKSGKKTHYSYGEPRCQNADCRSVYWGFIGAPKEVPSELLVS